MLLWVLLEEISGVSWSPTSKDIPVPIHGSISCEKFRSDYMVKSVSSYFTVLFLNRTSRVILRAESHSMPGVETWSLNAIKSMVCMVAAGLHTLRPLYFFFKREECCDATSQNQQPNWLIESRSCYSLINSLFWEIVQNIITMMEDRLQAASTILMECTFLNF